MLSHTQPSGFLGRCPGVSLSHSQEGFRLSPEVRVTADSRSPLPEDDITPCQWLAGCWCLRGSAMPSSRTKAHHSDVVT